jgi:hypothetical protein
MNRAHTYPELALPIDAAQERVFAAIDGNRSFDEILRAAAGAGGDKLARRFHPTAPGVRSDRVRRDRLGLTFGFADQRAYPRMSSDYPSPLAPGRGTALLPRSRALAFVIKELDRILPPIHSRAITVTASAGRVRRSRCAEAIQRPDLV